MWNRYAAFALCAHIGCLVGGGCTSALPAPEPPPQGSAQWVCAPGGPERCSDARDNNCNGLVDEGCGVHSGLVQFLIAWEDDADVDLDVTDPHGSQVRLGIISSAGLVKERDCPGRGERRCRGVNVENVVLAANREATAGTYVVVVRLAPRQEPKTPVAVNLTARLGPRVVSESLVVSKEHPQRVFSWSL